MAKAVSVNGRFPLEAVGLPLSGKISLSDGQGELHRGVNSAVPDDLDAGPPGVQPFDRERKSFFSIIDRDRNSIVAGPVSLHIKSHPESSSGKSSTFQSGKLTINVA